MAADILRLGALRPDTPILIPLLDGSAIEMSVKQVLEFIADAPPADCLKFLLQCRAVRANPFIGEAYLRPAKDKWVTIFGKSLYLRHAQDSPAYNGYEAGITVRAIEERNRHGQVVRVGPAERREGALLDTQWELLIGGWARVYRKGVDHHPLIEVSAAEYLTNDRGPHVTLAATMIRKVALVQALREAFGLGDSIDESEAGAARVDVRAARPAGPAPMPAPATFVGPECQEMVPADADGLPVLGAPPAAPADPPPPPMGGQESAGASELDDPAQLCGRHPTDPMAVGTYCLLRELVEEAVNKGLIPEDEFQRVLVARGVQEAIDLSQADACELIHKLREACEAKDEFPLEVIDPPAPSPQGEEEVLPDPPADPADLVAPAVPRREAPEPRRIKLKRRETPETAEPVATSAEGGGDH